MIRAVCPLLLAVAPLACTSVPDVGCSDDSAVPVTPAADPAAARRAFERLAALAGAWEGRSTQGWVARADFEVIAAGSVVVERTSFEAHPGETMMTVFALDGDRLGLQHFCVAGNQPRLVARAISGDATRLEFEYSGGGNLASRDVGHMDAVVVSLDGDEALSSQWSWYEAGQTRWMEEIVYRRLEEEAP